MYFSFSEQFSHQGELPGRPCRGQRASVNDRLPHDAGPAAERDRHNMTNKKLIRHRHNMTNKKLIRHRHNMTNMKLIRHRHNMTPPNKFVIVT
jgi:hypothetical protein